MDKATAKKFFADTEKHNLTSLKQHSEKNNESSVVRDHYTKEDPEQKDSIFKLFFSSFSFFFIKYVNEK
mgnify:CR=1 FL=1